MVTNPARRNAAVESARKLRNFYAQLLETNQVARSLFKKSPASVDALIAAGVFRPPEQLSLRTIKNYRVGQIGGKGALPKLQMPERRLALPAASSASKRGEEEQRVLNEILRVQRKHTYLGDWDVAKKVARRLGADEDKVYELICSMKEREKR